TVRRRRDRAVEDRQWQARPFRSGEAVRRLRSGNAMIDRESVIERSVDMYLRNQLFNVRGYPTEKVEILDAYPTNQVMTGPLDKNYIAIGWNTDDGGRQAELGSSLKRRVYTFVFYVFGTNRVWAKIVASVI